ncbi:Protein of unknown function [Propionibacterium freudenreichii]|nr:Protein of unknown function [Propionibacterium freudenreichii]CEH07646.1 Protein of unknown function [Propionibacterium freudenreichii]CEI26518.1 Protein of unknown function [Propionibacterium freudenreichii]
MSDSFPAEERAKTQATASRRRVVGYVKLVSAAGKVNEETA